MKTLERALARNSKNCSGNKPFLRGKDPNPVSKAEAGFFVSGKIFRLIFPALNRKFPSGFPQRLAIHKQGKMIAQGLHKRRDSSKVCMHANLFTRIGFQNKITALRRIIDSCDLTPGSLLGISPDRVVLDPEGGYNYPVARGLQKKQYANAAEQPHEGKKIVRIFGVARIGKESCNRQA